MNGFQKIEELLRWVTAIIRESNQERKDRSGCSMKLEVESVEAVMSKARKGVSQPRHFVLPVTNSQELICS